MLFDDLNKDFVFANYLAKVIAFCVAIISMLLSRYLLLFFVIAMLPTVVAIFMDRGLHKCFSATICSFNLIGVVPYLIKILNSGDGIIDLLAKDILVDTKTWIIIYCYALIGLGLYVILPKIFSSIYSKVIEIKSNELLNKREKLKQKWGIE